MRTTPRATLAIIVPVGPADTISPELIDLLARTPGDISPVVTAAIPRPARLPNASNLIWLEGRPGRGAQLNRGRAATDAQWLWFVHADCRIDAATIEAVTAFIERPTAALGYCQLRFMDDGPGLVHLNALGANLRSRLFGLPYGDQGLCVPSQWFDRLGGFREDLERGEDLDFVVRARSAGVPARPVKAPIRTSARRYRENGWLRTTWKHQIAALRLIRNARRAQPPSRQ